MKKNNKKGQPTQKGSLKIPARFFGSLYLKSPDFVRAKRKIWHPKCKISYPRCLPNRYVFTCQDGGLDRSDDFCQLFDISVVLGELLLVSGQVCSMLKKQDTGHNPKRFRKSKNALQTCHHYRKLCWDF